MNHPRTLVRAVLACALLASCGGGDVPPAATPSGYNISGTSPYPERLAMGQVVRNLILRAETRAGPGMNAQRCGYSFVLFDVTRASTQTATAAGASGDCKLYMTPPESDYTAQRWVCAGGINVESGAIVQNTGFCSTMGVTPAWERDFATCGGFISQRSAAVSSVDEIGMEDEVTDLSGTVRFPTVVEITQPTAFTVTTWPASGDLVVAWSSAEATSAMVRVEPDGATRAGPTIVCVPRVSGTMRIDAALLDRGGFRAMNARLRVWSFRETPTRAGGQTWNLVGATGTSVLLQPAR